MSNCGTGDLAPADEERIERLARVCVTTVAGIERAYQNSELPEAQYRVFSEEFRRVVTTYPVLLPRMRDIGERLGRIEEAYPILKPVFE